MSPAGAVRILVGIFGVMLVSATFGSAVRTVLLPRGVPSFLSRRVFWGVRGLFSLRAGPRASFERKDKVMALYAPMSLLILVLVWETLLMIGYGCLYWALGVSSFGRALQISGSSLLTLGTYNTRGVIRSALMFSEAGLGLLLLALLISFLPSLYSSFSTREAMVALLEVRAGSPPSALEMISRYHRIHGLGQLKDLWIRWEQWFVGLEETHTSFPSLVFFRSPQPEHSWITAAGAVLDAAALRASTIEGPRDPGAELCLRAGYLALRRIAGFFQISYDKDPKPTDPITIERWEYDEIWDLLTNNGVPLKSDREQAWRDFAGWRVNYDTPLVALAGFLIAPYAPWSSDRADKYWKFRKTGGHPQILRTPTPWFTSKDGILEAEAGPSPSMAEQRPTVSPDEVKAGQSASHQSDHDKPEEGTTLPSEDVEREQAQSQKHSGTAAQ